MNKILRYLAITALTASTLVPQAVVADDALQNWLDTLYFGMFAGGSILPNVVSQTDYSNTSAQFQETYEQGPGLAARLAIGGYVNSLLRAELELGFNRAHQGSIKEVVNGWPPATTYQGQGHIDTITLMGNLWADIPVLDESWGVTPYIGGGIGAALVKSNLSYTNFPAYGPQGSSLAIAAQLGAGINWAINDTISAGLGYRATFITGAAISQATSVNETTTYNFDNLISHSVGLTMMVSMN